MPAVWIRSGKGIKGEIQSGPIYCSGECPCLSAARMTADGNVVLRFNSRFEFIRGKIAGFGSPIKSFAGGNDRRSCAGGNMQSQEKSPSIQSIAELRERIEVIGRAARKNIRLLIYVRQVNVLGCKIEYSLHTVRCLRGRFAVASRSRRIVVEKQNRTERLAAGSKQTFSSAVLGFSTPPDGPFELAQCASKGGCRGIDKSHECRIEKSR